MIYFVVLKERNKKVIHDSVPQLGVRGGETPCGTVQR